MVSEADPKTPRTEEGPQGDVPDEAQPKLPSFEEDDAPTVSGETIADEVGASGGEANHASLLSEDEEEDPKSVEEARNQRAWPKWEVAMEEELNALWKRDVLSDVYELAPGRKTIGHHWVFVRKRDATGNVVRYKARLVAKGYEQKPGEDFSETYAPVMDATSYRYLLALAASHGLETETMDVVTAYLYGDLHHEIYMDVPDGYQCREQAI